MTRAVYFLERLPTPIGEALIVTDGQDYIRAFEWNDCAARLDRELRLRHGMERGLLVDRPSPSEVRRAVEAYFDGDLSSIDGLRVETGGTIFQREVWAALRKIPVGQTLSYGALAAQLGRPNAVRAVGLANGANPIGVVIPCHRVIGADGSLTGYGGGIERKRWLLAHEGVAAIGRSGELFREADGF